MVSINLEVKEDVPVEIRQLISSDAEKYWDLRLEALRQAPDAFLTSYDDAIKRKNPIAQVVSNLTSEGNYTFGAFEDDDLIGVVTLVQEKAEKIQHRANIFAMYVTPQKQGAGVGEALLTVAINKAKSIEGIEKINLSVVASNEPAKKLYTKLGFNVYGLEEKAMKLNGVYLDDEHRVLHIK